MLKYLLTQKYLYIYIYISRIQKLEALLIEYWILNSDWLSLYKKIHTYKTLWDDHVLNAIT